MDGVILSVSVLTSNEVNVHIYKKGRRWPQCQLFFDLCDFPNLPLLRSAYGAKISLILTTYYMGRAWFWATPRLSLLRNFMAGFRDVLLSLWWEFVQILSTTISISIYLPTSDLQYLSIALEDFGRPTLALPWHMIQPERFCRNSFVARYTIYVSLEMFLLQAAHRRSHYAQFWSEISKIIIRLRVVQGRADTRFKATQEESYSSDWFLTWVICVPIWHACG